MKHICENCLHFAEKRPSEPDSYAGNPYFCTLRPKWEPVTPEHYCGAFQIGAKR